MFDLVISPDSIKRKRWDYNEETEEGKYVYEDVKDLAVHLGSYVEFEGKVTFERIFDLIIENKDLYNLVFHSQMGGYAIEAFIDDYNGAEKEGPGELEFLEIYFSGDHTTYNDDSTDIHYNASFHGWGKWSEEYTPGSHHGPIGIGFSSIADYRKLELKLAEEAEFGIAPKIVNDKRDYISYKGKTAYTWYDIVGAILYEISWYGTPDKRNQSKDELKVRADEAKKAIESGDMSKFHPIDELFDDLDKDE